MDEYLVKPVAPTLAIFCEVYGETKDFNVFANSGFDVL
jgi:hypothetical protein